jgi:predicted  nucleic acid-binding Zn-ribbon protein
MQQISEENTTISVKTIKEYIKILETEIKEANTKLSSLNEEFDYMDQEKNAYHNYQRLIHCRSMELTEMKNIHGYSEIAANDLLKEINSLTEKRDKLKFNIRAHAYVQSEICHVSNYIRTYQKAIVDLKNTIRVIESLRCNIRDDNYGFLFICDDP